MSARRRGPGRAVARDVGSFLLGWGLIYQQALFVDPAKVNQAFLWVAVTLIMGPVGFETVARVRSYLGGMSPSESERQRPASQSSSRSTSQDDDE